MVHQLGSFTLQKNQLQCFIKTVIWFTFKSSFFLPFLIPPSKCAGRPQRATTAARSHLCCDCVFKLLCTFLVRLVASAAQLSDYPVVMFISRHIFSALHVIESWTKFCFCRSASSSHLSTLAHWFPQCLFLGILPSLSTFFSSSSASFSSGGSVLLNLTTRIYLSSHLLKVN